MKIEAKEKNRHEHIVICSIGGLTHSTRQQQRQTSRKKSN